MGFVNEFRFRSFGCAPPKFLSDFIIEANWKFFPHFKLQGRQLLCYLLFYIV